MYYHLHNTTTRILGTFHLFPRAAPPPPARVAEAGDWAQALCIEHDYPQIAPFMTLPPGMDLEALVPPGTWQSLTRYWPAEASLDGLHALKLWAAFMHVAQRVLNGELGVEGTLMQQAAAAGKPIHQLEQGAELASFMDRIPIPLLAKEIAGYADPAEQRRIFRALHAAWLTGDSDAVWKVQSQLPVVQEPEIYGPMFALRNRLWADRILAVAPARSDRVLIAVGAAHLVGPDNLIDLLRARGMDSSRI